MKMFNENWVRPKTRVTYGVNEYMNNATFLPLYVICIATINGDIVKANTCKGIKPFGISYNI